VTTTTIPKTRMAFSPSSSGTEDRPWVYLRCQCRRGTSEESTQRRCPRPSSLMDCPRTT
jgi:hypothetical protein